MIVSTSTLELGIDVGDLDRVLQINAPGTVAAFLQRLGRTGRRPGTTRNCLFLALSRDALLSAAGLLLLWGRGYVEPVTAPPQPRHIVAQQLLALCLQENKVGRALWHQSWNGLAPFDRSAEPIIHHLLAEGFLEQDGELLFIGPQAEAKFGRRHFMGMTAVFTAPPQFTVLSGRQEIGRTNPALLTEKVEGPRLLLLAGRSWRVTWTDWKRRRCFVEQAEGPSAKPDGTPGSAPPMRRCIQAAPSSRGTARTSDGGPGPDTGPTPPSRPHSAGSPTPRSDSTTRQSACAPTSPRRCLPHIDERALKGLKFNEAIPERLATATLAARLADLDSAIRVLAEPARFVSSIS